MRSRILRNSRHEPVQERGFKSRQKVLLAARRILVRRGYQAMKIGEITKEALVGHGTFYHYFRNKQDVLEALLEEMYGELNKARFPVQLEAGQVEKQICGGITSYLKAYHKNRQVLLALQPARLESARIRKFFDNMREREVQWLVGEFERIRLQERGLDGNLEVLSLALLNTVDSVARDWISRYPHLSLQEVAEMLCEIWSRAIQPVQATVAAASST